MELRLADPLVGLSMVADLGFGLPPGEAVRSGALATGLARLLDLPEQEVRAVYYTALLQHVGCVGYAHETAAVFGDELAMNLAAARTNFASPRDLFTTFLPELTRGRGPMARVGLTVAALRGGSRFGARFVTATCEVGRVTAGRLGLGEAVQDALYHVYGLPVGDLRRLQLAALLHDLGRVAVSTAVWEQPRPLGSAEWEQVRLHPYYSERILAG
jgi:hypothetical protein